MNVQSTRVSLRSGDGGQNETLVPSGAPGTGGGSGGGVRSPALLATGIMLLIGAGALLLRRLRAVDQRR